MRQLSSDGLAAFLLIHPCTKVLDVRFAYEQGAWQMPDSHHVPLYTPGWNRQPDFIGQVRQRISPDDYVLVICHNGHVSCEAAALLEEAGFIHVYNLIGGYQDIRETGYAVFVEGNLTIRLQPSRS